MSVKMYYRRRKNFRWTEDLEMEMLEDIIISNKIIDGCVKFASKYLISSAAVYARYRMLSNQFKQDEQEEQIHTVEAV